jgi:transposase InsO family protein
MSVPASAKYAIIREMTLRDNNLLNITWLCTAAGVSRSGYYHYIEAEYLRQQREEQDRKDFLIILEAYQFRSYSKGARSIYMRLLHKKPPIHMNIKKIRRLMNKYNLFCPIRKANPHRRAAKTIVTTQVVPNLLNREFEARGPRKVLLTDITYIINGKAPRCYMCTIIDACTKELLAWTLSASLEIDFVLDAVNFLIKNHGVSLTAETLIHSDQGSHYKSVKFVRLVKDSELRQSMSRKANCWDNAPQESFYGHMKDEIDISLCSTFDEVMQVIAAWADYYNNDRYQWDLARLAPREYYEYRTTGEYPLMIPKAKGSD